MIDFKTAKEIVLALKKIAANISSDKSSSNTNTNTDGNTNTDTNNDNLNYIVFNNYSLEHGAAESTIIFKLHSDEDKVSVFDKSEKTLGQLFDSNNLIKLFNKAIEIIREMIDEKGFNVVTVYIAYNIEKNYNDSNDFYYQSTGNLVEAVDRRTIHTDLVVKKTKLGYRIDFYDSNNISNLIGATEDATVFDENTPINWINNGGSGDGPK